MKHFTSTRAGCAHLASPLLIALLAGCASVPSTATQVGTTKAAESHAEQVGAVSTAASAPAAAASGAAGGSAAKSTVATTNGLRPFAEIIKDAKRIDGLFTLWPKGRQGLDRAGAVRPRQAVLHVAQSQDRYRRGPVLRRPDGEEVVIEFRRVHNNLQMLAKNTEFVAKANTPAAAPSMPLLTEPVGQARAC